MSLQSGLWLCGFFSPYLNTILLSFNLNSTLLVCPLINEKVLQSFITSGCLIIVGECKSRFTSRKVPYCIKYHPEEDKQHLFVAGTSDKKIVCVSDLIHLKPCVNIKKIRMNKC